MAKTNAERNGGEERKFSSGFLYSSPQEASNLRAWVREVESTQRDTGSGSPPLPRGGNSSGIPAIGAEYPE